MRTRTETETETGATGASPTAQSLEPDEGVASVCTQSLTKG